VGGGNLHNPQLVKKKTKQTPNGSNQGEIKEIEKSQDPFAALITTEAKREKKLKGEQSLWTAKVEVG